MIQPPMYLFRLHLSRLNGGVRSLNPLKGGMKEAALGVTARRQTEKGDDKAAKRGGEPECEHSVEEGHTDAIDVLGDGLVRQPVERVHLLDGDLQCHAEILAGPLALVAAGGSGEGVDVPEREAVLEECGRGGVAVRDGGAVGSVIGVRGQWTLLGCAVVVAAPGVAVLEQLLKQVVECLREVHYPREVEVGVFLGEGGAYVVAEGLECHAPLPEARSAAGVIEGFLPVLTGLSPVTEEIVVKGEQLVWRAWRSGEEATQGAAEPGEGRRCAAAEGAENVHDASALGGTGGQPDLRECVGEGSESDVLRVGGQRQAAEVYQGHVGVPGVRLLRLEQRRHGIMSDGQMHGIVRKPAAPCEHLVDVARRPGRGMHLEVARLIILMEVRAEAIEEL
ncbi:hypothetical protein BOVATA_026680 [Babesia ovata]|uniref:Uncharacterized protein n=1 Tax=Babesia ovata TaxID=189622 RepID=A0A2H6KDV7_9APIC|nr:uncharacterized protein BOVATA_026680 [Babesia ovata]GBE61175.1 hypothetical protein BOVATA_026680 [Babesia ovata]